MKTDCTAQKMQFQPLGRRRVEAAFDGGTVTSDGGALLLREVERARGIVARFAACFDDLRDPDRIEHTVLELVGQRVFGLCLGYEDLVDHDVLRRDPMLAILCGKQDPSGQSRKRERDRGAALAGKSTLNRLELTELQCHRQREMDRGGGLEWIGGGARRMAVVTGFWSGGLAGWNGMVQPACG